MRPRGDIRLALCSAAELLHAECGGATWRDMAARGCVGFAAAKQTVRNMAQAGELVAVGEQRTAHSRRPMTLFAPGTRAIDPAGAQQRLADVMGGWRAQRG